MYVKSEDNYADLMTKNVNRETHEILFVEGIQKGVIKIRRENVGRTATMGLRTDDPVMF